MTTAFARLSFGGGMGGSAAADGLRKTTVVATTKAARNMCQTLQQSFQSFKARPAAAEPRECLPARSVST